MLADSDDPTDVRPQKECIFFSKSMTSTTIVKTPCQHLMHKECLSRWLQTGHFCPICRGDVEDCER